MGFNVKKDEDEAQVNELVDVIDRLNLVLATEKSEDTLTVQEKEEQSREQTGIIAPRSIAVYEGVVMAASQDKEKKVSARSLKKKTDVAGER